MSSNQPLLKVNNLSKMYPLYREKTDRLLQSLFPWKKYFSEFWALREVSFSMQKGESVAFLGRNGAGKSTLLQLICGTLTPTSGEVQVRGKISALLELGSGFNPEFTGRENVFLYCAILGMSRSYVNEIIQDIIEFADIGEFIDQPVKTYSSGMLVRLAFSAAVFVEPDLLVVDEALAVGDARFSAKCITKIRKMQESGVSILFVGHDVEAIIKVCRTGHVLHKGKIVFSGLSKEAVQFYEALVSSDFNLTKMSGPKIFQGHDRPEASTKKEPTDSSCQVRQEGDVANFGDSNQFKTFRYGDGSAEITHLQIENLSGARTEVVSLGEMLTLRLRVRFNKEVEAHVIGFYINDQHGLRVIGVNTYQELFLTSKVQNGSILEYTFKIQNDLKPGTYSLSPAVAYNQSDPVCMDAIENGLVFKVRDPNPGRTVFGVVLPRERIVDCTIIR